MSKNNSPTADRHRGGIMIRLPESYRVALAELRKVTDRPTTTDVRRALDAYLLTHGLTPPGSST